MPRHAPQVLSISAERGRTSSTDWASEATIYKSDDDNHLSLPIGDVNCLVEGVEDNGKPEHDHDYDVVVVVVDDDDDVGVVEVIGEEDGKPLNKAKVGQHHGHVDRTESIRFRSLAKTNLSCYESFSSLRALFYAFDTSCH